ncbi:MAG: acetyltransferase-like isoleucine patch superfamily enzyme [Myxococcota bacterium]|jgi:acetyltransferase-like isoleucine patch superfamily enzyme
MSDETDYIAQHKRRLSWMPWLYFALKDEQRGWARAWQAELQATLVALEQVTLGENVFISPEAQLFAEPQRAIAIGSGSGIAADVFMHGPITLGERVSVNARVSMDGGRAGITIGDGTRIATGAKLFAFDHGMDPTAEVMSQPVTSRGIRIGSDVWVGADAGITDGVTLGDHVVVGMGAVVTRDFPDWAIVAGSPARVIGDRRDR